MLAWIVTSGFTCILCGDLASKLPPATTAQSYLYLGMAIAGTICLGAFDAFETQAGQPKQADEA
jgi:hypothetical protein